MLLFSSILGILLSVILLVFNAQKNGSTIYLGFFFLLISLYGFYQYVLLYSKSVLLVEILLTGFAIVFPVLYLIGPMLYWYIRSVLTDDSRWKRKDIWHLLPTVIYFLAALPYTLVPFSAKMEAAIEVVKDVSYMQTYHSTILDQLFPVSAIYLSRPILVLVYTLWSVGLFINYVVKKKASEVLSQQHFMKKWLCLLLGFLLVLEVTQIFLIIKAFEMHFSDLYFTLNVLRIFSAAGMIGLMISPFFFPVILYGLPRVPQSFTTTNRSDEPLSKPAEKRGQNFESDYILTIDETITLTMKEYQPYLQPDCNLAYISKLINIPTHHLAYYFREVKKQPFNDFRNEWRINHAKALIKEGKASEITLEAIGTLSGFSSRNAFITDFKKIEGVSPGAYASRYN